MNAGRSDAITGHVAENDSPGGTKGRNDLLEKGGRSDPVTGDIARNNSPWNTQGRDTPRWTEGGATQ